MCEHLHICIYTVAYVNDEFMFAKPEWSILGSQILQLTRWIVDVISLACWWIVVGETSLNLTCFYGIWAGETSSDSPRYTSFEPRLRCRCCRCSSQTHSQPFLLSPPPPPPHRIGALWKNKPCPGWDCCSWLPCTVEPRWATRAVPTTLADPTKSRVLWVGGVSKPREIILRGSDGIWKHLRKRILTFFSIPWFVTWQF